MAVAILKPFRRGNDLLMRGRIGPGGVSVFYPWRSGDTTLWRGKDCQGSVVYGFPFRQGDNLLARAIYRDCAGGNLPNIICSCPPNTFRTTYTITVAGFATACPFPPCDPGTQLQRLNGVYTVTFNPNMTGLGFDPGVLCSNRSSRVGSLLWGNAAGTWFYNLTEPNVYTSVILVPICAAPRWRVHISKQYSGFQSLSVQGALTGAACTNPAGACEQVWYNDWGSNLPNPYTCGSITIS